MRCVCIPGLGQPMGTPRPSFNPAQYVPVSPSRASAREPASWAASCLPRCLGLCCLGSLAVIVVLEVVGYALLKSRPSPVPSPDAPAVVTEYTLGDFVLAVSNASQSPSLRVTHLAKPEAPVLESREGVPLVRAMIPLDDLRGKAGHFDIVNANLDTCNLMFNTKVAHEGGEVALEGFLGKSGRAAFSWFLSWLIVSSTRCPSIRYRLSFAHVAHEPKQLDLRLSLTSTAGPEALWHQRSVLTFSRRDDEAIYGAGMQYNVVNMAGHRVPVACSENGIGRGTPWITWALNEFQNEAGGDEFTTWSCVPHLLTSRTRGVFLNNSNYVVFDMQRPRTIAMEVLDAQVRGRLIVGDSPLDYLTEVTKLTGRMPPLPDWAAKGAIVSLQGGKQRVSEITQKLLDHGVVLPAIWVQDWCGRRVQELAPGVTLDRVAWNWEVDRLFYPDWDEWAEDLDKQGVKMLTYINPFLVDVSGLPDAEKRWQRQYYQEAKDAGLLVTKENGEPFMISQGPGFDAAMMDFYNPQARDFYKNVIRENMLRRKHWGWMGDFGEWYPITDLNMSLHNDYPYEWSAVQREAMDDWFAGKEDHGFFFARSASKNSPAVVTMFWQGDQGAGWGPKDGFPSALVGITTSGLSGHTLTHSDTGGYNQLYYPPFLFWNRTEELLRRWTEASIFSAMLRTHEGASPAKSAQVYDDGVIDHFAHYTRLFASMLEYRKELMTEAYEKGWPLVRHLWLHFPEDLKVRDVATTFMFGPDLLVSPVLKPQVDRWKVYLPKGVWMHVWSRANITSGGEKREVSAPLGEPPAFLRLGSGGDGDAPPVRASLLPFLDLACSVSFSCSASPAPSQISPVAAGRRLHV